MALVVLFGNCIAPRRRANHCRIKKTHNQPATIQRTMESSNHCRIKEMNNQPAQWQRDDVLLRSVAIVAMGATAVDARVETKVGIVCLCFGLESVVIFNVPCVGLTIPKAPNRPKSCHRYKVPTTRSCGDSIMRRKKERRKKEREEGRKKERKKEREKQGKDSKRDRENEKTVNHIHPLLRMPSNPCVLQGSQHRLREQFIPH